jgi:hypothetical protein
MFSKKIVSVSFKSTFATLLLQILATGVKNQRSLSTNRFLATEYNKIRTSVSYFLSFVQINDCTLDIKDDG